MKDKTHKRDLDGYICEEVNYGNTTAVFLFRKSFISAKDVIGEEDMNEETMVGQ